MALDETVGSVKRLCLMCHTYRTFKPEEAENSKQKALRNLDELVGYFKNQFDSLRRKDAEISLINKANYNKTVCLDASSLCQRCDKQVDQARRQLAKLQL